MAPPMLVRAYSTLRLVACLLAGIFAGYAFAEWSTAIAAPFGPVVRLDPIENGNYVTLLPLTNVASSPPFKFHSGPLHWSIENTVRSADFGNGLAGPGDVNGDGFADLLISARALDGMPVIRAGFFFLLLGGSDGFVSEPILFRGPSGNYYGGHVSAAGDVNGDGLPDFFCGSPLVPAPPQEMGKARGWFGRRDQAWNEPDWGWKGSFILPGTQRFGGSLCRAGDVNGDGFDDLLVAAPRFNHTNGSRGVVFLFLGSASGPAATPSWTAFGSTASSAFGAALAPAGDVNGDGFADVLIGDPGPDEDPISRGRAYVYLGSPSGLQTNPVWTVEGTEPGGRFGTSLAGGFDCDKDGCSEIIIGAPGTGRNYPGPGYVALYKGSRQGPQKQPAWTAAGSVPGGKYGYRMASVGDINGDGFPDIAISAPFTSGTEARSGFVYLYFGNGDTITLNPVWLCDGGMPGAHIGWSLCGLGDINHDGLADFAIGSPHYANNKGRVDVFLGSTNAYRPDVRFPADGTNAFFGQDPVVVARWREEKARAAHSVSQQVAAALSTVMKQIKTNPPTLVTTNITVVHTAPGFVHLPLKLSVGSLAGGSALAFVLWRRRATKRERLAAAQAARARHDERQRIARDLHDDLGARLTRISVLTELVRRKSAAGQENTREAQLLADTAGEVLGSMEEILWSVNPSNDTLENLVAFILQYAGPFLAPTGIELSSEAPTVLPADVLPADVRKNIFLCFKEALNNIAKHSGATRVRLEITCSHGDAGDSKPDHNRVPNSSNPSLGKGDRAGDPVKHLDRVLTIQIRDNGRGLPQGEVALTSDGLKNMRARMQSIGGQFEITSPSQGGTRILLSLPLST